MTSFYTKDLFGLTSPPQKTEDQNTHLTKTIQNSTQKQHIELGNKNKTSKR